MGNSRTSAGHIAALVTISIWGITFVSTKILLRTFTPIEILFVRFTIGYIALWCVYPKVLPFTGKKRELCFAAAGLCGITLYYLFENIALTFTQASNVGVIVSAAPFFTALLSRRFLKEEKTGPLFYAGFALALAGISLISFSGGKTLRLNPLGDALALTGAAIWAVYSTLTKKISFWGFTTIQITRRVFFYGLIFMLPVIFLTDFKITLADLTGKVNLLNLLFLGLGASALCFVTWNFAVKAVGSVKTSVYIYLTPVITVATATVILQEQVTVRALWGIGLTLAGLILSESKNFADLFPQKTK